MIARELPFKLEIFAGSAVLTWVLVGVLVRLAEKVGLVDRPNERSLHTRVTPRGGGLGFVVVSAVAVTAYIDLGGGPLRALVIAMSCALFIAAISLRDDFKSLSAGFRLVCQLAAASAAVAAAGWFRSVLVPGLGEVHLGWVGMPLTVLWIVGATNVYNFMDGIDGIAGVQGMVAGLAWAAAGAWFHTPAVTLLGLLLCSGCLGFLFHNWSPARIFMGDVGSAFLGYSFGIMPLISLDDRRGPEFARVHGALPLFALLVIWPFVGDGLLTFLRRARRREPVWKPHRSHLYQRLVRSGWTHPQVTLLYAAWCAASTAVGLVWLFDWPGASVAAALFPPASLGALFAFVGRVEREKGGGGD